jgi:hypothetical protein
MKIKRLLYLVLLVVFATSISFVSAADDGPLFRRNISRTPEQETGAAALSMMPFYVEAQNTQGELTPIDYLVGEDSTSATVLYTRDNARPLFVSYNDGVEAPESELRTGTGFGHRDAFGALSLDDGATWKDYNLSDSALRSSFVLANGEQYPGDVFRIVHSVVGNRILVAWISRYCESGSPLYAYAEEDLDALLAERPDLVGPYTTDLFGVAGSQGSVDYTLQGFPEVGEIPYGCVWTARGTLEEDPNNENQYDIIWRSAERLTSGRRDANRVEIAGVSGAGFILSWQEDPEGLRPGKGLGPGEGWSGAIVNAKTDIWYTYIAWDDFDDVTDDETVYIEPTNEDLYAFDTRPKIAIPFAVPIRLTDNNNCDGRVKYDPDGNIINAYCYYDFDTGTQYDGPHPDADFCAYTVPWETGGGVTKDICVTEDGRALTGKTGACRVRWSLQGYDQDGDTLTDSAWVVMAFEELKGLGSEVDEDGLPLDIGKDMFYMTFDMFNPEFIAQGLQLNRPATDPASDPLSPEFFPVLVDEWGYEFYETEIARRFNLMTQSPANVGDSGTVAFLIYKQGIIFQGGPADIFVRRIILPDTFDPAVDNPYDYANIECEDWAYADGSNPNYVRGLCLDAPMNVSASTPECEDGNCEPFYTWIDGEPIDRVIRWTQTIDNLDDESWENPFDVSKGHRGFIDGDFIMMMYASSPNWKANTVGNDHYNLFVRRSFDGGATWTTLPSNYAHVDGSTWTGDGTYWCEYMNVQTGDGEFEEVCYDLAAGEFEPARNVSRLSGNRITVLDPRYAPTPGGVLTMFDGTTLNEADLPEEVRDPSGYFVTYETGDNTVVSIDSAAVPLDMYYSRAFNWGDDYDVVEFTTQSGQLVERWDWLENGPELATEASLRTIADGSRFYSVWNQELEIAPEVYTDMDVAFRRILYNFDSDSYPYATIIYASHSAAGYNEAVDLRFVGTAQDSDHVGEGIVAYRWASNIDGELSTNQILNIPVTDLSIGFHTLSFSAQDDEGNWATEKVITLLIAEELHRTYIPIVVR